MLFEFVTCFTLLLLLLSSSCALALLDLLAFVSDSVITLYHTYYEMFNVCYFYMCDYIKIRDLGQVIWAYI